uniref:Immunoglobulin I-set domain-containing protein n=1 Tax=Timema monikensis TaxID=170555 RepID=A0A7R9DYL9_9NEOP|nr:unnamed protein product [Timema monikensis]
MKGVTDGERCGLENEHCQRRQLTLSLFPLRSFYTLLSFTLSGPRMKASSDNNLLPSGEQTVEGISITIEQANRHQAGIYLCTAANGVGEPVSQQINLHVL